jgi:hypothetical protein
MQVGLEMGETDPNVAHPSGDTGRERQVPGKFHTSAITNDGHLGKTLRQAFELCGGVSQVFLIAEVGDP